MHPAVLRRFMALTILIESLALSVVAQGQGSTGFSSEVMYEWVTVDFDWPSECMKSDFIADGRFVPEHNLISGIKTYRDEIYVSVPRLRYTTGVPSTLNKVVTRGDKSVLQPFPNWDAQEPGNCEALQCAMSMEVDPLTGYMYVIDPGRTGIFGDGSPQPPPVLCPPKLVVYDLNDGHLVRSHDLPEHLVSKKTNFLNDIVLDRGSPDSREARWVYITDAVDSKLISFDLKTNETHIFTHSSMDYDHGPGADITVNGKTYTLRTPIDGLAISADFRYVYYCALGSKDLYQVSSDVLRDPSLDFDASVRFLGAKTSQTGGMTFAGTNLYYGALTQNAVYRWEIAKDAEAQKVGPGSAIIQTETMIVKDDVKLNWPDSFTVDEHGYLWFTACRAHLFLKGGMDFSGASGANYRIWRVNINESSYLAGPNSSTTLSNG